MDASIDVVAYRRYSPRNTQHKTAENGETSIKSLEQQELAITSFLASRGLPEPDEWIDDVLTSARKTPLGERPGGKRLLAKIRAGSKNIVVASLSRIFRNVVDGISTLDDWQTRGVTLMMADGVVLDLGTANGRFICQILLSQTEHEAGLCAERTALGHRWRKTQNRRTSKWPRFGFMFDESGEMHPLSGLPVEEIPHSGEQKLLRIMRQQRDQYISRDAPVKCSEIASVLNRGGYKPQSIRCSADGSYRWWPSTVKRILASLDERGEPERA